LKELGITVLSISHKNELKKLHDFELHYNADGSYNWIQIDASMSAAAVSHSSTSS
jgi:hypothetical protein